MSIFKNTNEYILVADDEKDWRTKIGEFLKRSGYKICYAGNKNTAINKIRNNKIKLAVVNINLNGGELKKGWQFDWTELLDEANKNNISVISITGDEKINFNVIKEKATKYQVTGVLFKHSFDTIEFTEQIEKNINLEGFENYNIYISVCSSIDTNYQEPSLRAVLMNHIANNDIKSAIEYLKNIEKIKNSELEDDLVIILSNYNRLCREYTYEKVTRDIFNCEITKINRSIIDIFNTAKTRENLDIEESYA
ncbi:MAG: response regulator [Candidatus Electrothrix gigas]